MTTFLLARHGETDWNAERRVQGHVDRPLNDRGRAQAQRLAEELADEQLDAVYSSDLVRARDTAAVVARAHGLPVVARNDLREKHFGTWEGMTDAEVMARFPDARTRSWGDAETPEELSKRVVAALHDIAVAHPRGRVLVVTHGGPLRAVLRHCAGPAEGSIANCHVLRIAVEDGAMRPVD